MKNELNIDSLRRDFEKWRQAKVGQERMPEDLVRAAAILAERMSVATVAKCYVSTYADSKLHYFPTLFCTEFRVLTFEQSTPPRQVSVGILSRSEDLRLIDIRQ